VPWKRQEQVSDSTFYKDPKIKLPCTAVGAFFDEFEVLFKVVGDGADLIFSYF